MRAALLLLALAVTATRPQVAAHALHGRRLRQAPSETSPSAPELSATPSRACGDAPRSFVTRVGAPVMNFRVSEQSRLCRDKPETLNMRVAVVHDAARRRDLGGFAESVERTERVFEYVTSAFSEIGKCSVVFTLSHTAAREVPRRCGAVDAQLREAYDNTYSDNPHACCVLKDAGMCDFTSLTQDLYCLENGRDGTDWLSPDFVGCYQLSQMAWKDESNSVFRIFKYYAPPASPRDASNDKIDPYALWNELNDDRDDTFGGDVDAILFMTGVDFAYDLAGLGLRQGLCHRDGRGAVVSSYEIDVVREGQLVAHELGHLLGMRHSNRGLMKHIQEENDDAFTADSVVEAVQFLTSDKYEACMELKTAVPTAGPSAAPTSQPTSSPSTMPSTTPSTTPSATPTAAPSSAPTFDDTYNDTSTEPPPSTICPAAITRLYSKCAKFSNRRAACNGASRGSFARRKCGWCNDHCGSKQDPCFPSFEAFVDCTIRECPNDVRAFNICDRMSNRECRSSRQCRPCGRNTCVPKNDADPFGQCDRIEEWKQKCI